MVGHQAILLTRSRLSPSSAAQITQLPVAVTNKSERDDQLGLADLIEWKKL